MRPTYGCQLAPFGGVTPIVTTTVNASYQSLVQPLCETLTIISAHNYKLCTPILYTCFHKKLAPNICQIRLYFDLGLWPVWCHLRCYLWVIAVGYKPQVAPVVVSSGASQWYDLVLSAVSSSRNGAV